MEQNNEIQLTDEMQEAFDLVENTTQCLYITGKAGTGKTTLLRYLRKRSKKNMIVAAPTGIAAVNAGGATLHSLFTIPLGVINPFEPMTGAIKKAKFNMFQKMELLVIDEISMVRPDILDYIDKKLKLYRHNESPFGGVQVVMFGDLYQLPPVIKKTEEAVLLQFYRGLYFFFAHVWHSEGFRVIELSHVFRQKDPRFVEILNNIRNYRLPNRDVEDLDKVRDRRECLNYGNGYVHICAYKKDVEQINSTMLGEPTHHYDAKTDGSFSKSSIPCDEMLNLRVGARVMMLVNDTDRRFYNGSLGVVYQLNDNSVGVRLDSGLCVTVEPFEWVANEYKLENGKIVKEKVGSCRQIPVSLAWAITIHKSQGLTFEKVAIHAKKFFCQGMLYVALSRCTSMDGIVSETFIDRRHIIPDNQLMAFDKACRNHNMIFNKDTYRNMNLR